MTGPPPAPPASGRGEPVLDLQGVSKSFPSPGRGAPAIAALDGVGFTVQPGRIVGLVGPDAAGKTTLLRVCAGLVEPDAGSVAVFGAPLEKIDRARIGYMPQAGALYAELSVAQNLALYARLRGLAPDLEGDRIAHLLRRSPRAPPGDCPAGCGRSWRWPARWSPGRR
jgi:ABC-2 type transport system ATP-binding protein